MANAPMGNNFLEGVLGVVNVNWDNTDFGKTTADTEINIDQDIKDIIYQQDGTKYADKVRTGIVFQVNATFGVITTTLLSKLDRGLVKSGDGNSMKFGRNLYTSWKTSEAKKLILTRVDSEGANSTNQLFKMTFYKAAPEITSPIQYGADTQRQVGVTFHIFYDDDEQAFGYSGYASSLGLTP